MNRCVCSFQPEDSETFIFTVEEPHEVVHLSSCQLFKPQHPLEPGSLIIDLKPNEGAMLNPSFDEVAPNLHLPPIVLQDRWLVTGAHPPNVNVHKQSEPWKLFPLKRLLTTSRNRTTRRSLKFGHFKKQTCCLLHASAPNTVTVSCAVFAARNPLLFEGKKLRMF